MNITVNLLDTYCTKCSKTSISKNEQITSRAATLELQNGFNFNVLSSNDKSCAVMIQNGQKVIIRVILFDVETSILIPSCCTHILTLTCSDNT